MTAEAILYWGTVAALIYFGTGLLMEGRRPWDRWLAFIDLGIALVMVLARLF